MATAPARGEDALAARSATSLPIDTAEQLGEWEPVEDAASGDVFWVISATRQSSWDAPRASQCVPRAPFRIERAGHMREPVVAALDAAAPPVPSDMRVLHNVVWERSLLPGAAGLWRIAKM